MKIKKTFWGFIVPAVITIIVLFLTACIMNVIPMTNGEFLITIVVQSISSFVLSKWLLLCKFCGMTSAEFWTG